MEKSKRSKPQTECHDRLSELPDSLISHILWFVPMKDVVRTTVLSKRWENRWTTTPFLNFDMQDYDDLDKIQHFVNRALLRWNGIRILKFRALVKYPDVDDSIYGETELWVNFAKDNGVEELYLQLEIYEFFNYDRAFDLFMVPRCLYSCSSLEVLSVSGCNFRINGNVQWNQLKSLRVTDCMGVTKHVINQIMSGSPRLEVLNLSFVDSGESLNIVSDSLKELLIWKSLYYLEYISEITELTIFSPKLETLKIGGVPYTNYPLIYVPSLTYATIWFYGQTYGGDYDCDNFFNEFELENGFSSIQDYIGNSIRQILQTIQHVQNVRLSFCCVKVLRALKMRCILSSFPNVKSLKIGHCFDSYEQLVGLLDIFPQLERLVLQGLQGYYHQDDPEAVDEAKLPESFLPQLKTIEVTWKDGDNIFIVLETLLKHASKLEQLVFRVKGILPPNSLLSASKKLLNMPRSSAICKISFLASDPQP